MAKRQSSAEMVIDLARNALGKFSDAMLAITPGEVVDYLSDADCEEYVATMIAAHYSQFADDINKVARRKRIEAHQRVAQDDITD